MKPRRKLSVLLSFILMVVLVFATTTTAFAATGNKKVTSSGKMSIVLNTGQTGNSSAVSFKVSGLPTNAVITKLEVNTGSLSSYSGAMLTNYLTLTSSNKTTAEKITWGGQANTTLKSNGFLATKANGTYTITFNCTCLGGAIVGGIPTDVGSKTYSSPYITVYWDDSF